MFFKKSPALASTSFQHIMNIADILAEEGNVEGLKDLIKLVLRPIQSVHLLDAYTSAQHEGKGSLCYTKDIGIEGLLHIVLNGQIVNNKGFVAWCISETCMVDDKSLYPHLELSKDIVLSTPWHLSSLTNTIGSIGQHRSQGMFRQGQNHVVIYQYPLMIGWVSGGNHSIMQGILQGGALVPEEVHDISPLIGAVKFDEKQWICCHSGVPLGKPRYSEFGWCWEIARKIISLESSPYKK